MLTSHHFCRVALDAERTEARVISCAFEHAASGAVDIRFRSGEEVNLGPLMYAWDGHLLSSAMWNVSLPEGSDGRTVLVQREAVATGIVDVSAAGSTPVTEPNRELRRCEFVIHGLRCPILGLRA